MALGQMVETQARIVDLLEALSAPQQRRLAVSN